MAKLWITELKNLAAPSVGTAPQVAMHPPVAEQTVTFSGTSAQSAATATDTTYVRICSDVVCHYAVGSNPTATTDSTRLPADAVEHIGIPAGYKIAVIAAA